MQRILNGLSSMIARVTILLTIILTALMVAIVVIGVFFRYALHDALSWSGEAAVFLFTWITFLVASLGVREGFHVQITLVRERMPGGVVKAVSAAVEAAILLFGLMLVLGGDGGVASVSEQTSAALGYPLWMLYVSVPVCGVLISVHALARLWPAREQPESVKEGGVL